MRLKKIQKILREKEIDCLILSSLAHDDKNLLYLLKEYIKNCLLIIPKKGKCRVLVPEMEYGYAKKALDVPVFKFEKGFSKDIKKLLLKLNAKHLAINKGAISVKEYESLKKIFKYKISDLGDCLLNQRSVKEKDEIDKISCACRFTDKVFESLVSNIGSLKKEEDVKKYLMKQMFNYGGVSFNPVVASGKNSGYVHYEGSNKKMGKGFMLIDFGVMYKGYCSDMTRTIYIGRPQKKEIELYDFLLEIQEKACKMIRPGVNSKDIDLFVREKMGKYEAFYNHGLGHGVGLNVHEYPFISKNSNFVLKEGMVLTVEPGIYFPGKKGIRIEDTVLVTKKGNRILTKSKKNLIEIKKRV